MPRGESTSVEDNRELIRLIIEEGHNRGDLSVADGRFDPDYTVHVPGRADLPAKGPETFKKQIGMWRTAFSDWHMEIEDLVAEGDMVANRYMTTGTNDGPLKGIPPTGRKMVVHGMEMHRVRDGKVVESWVSDLAPAILVQLGVI